jgi:hypothetical protein
MLTRLSDVLFDLESDLTAIKIDNFSKKLTTTRVINLLPSKYTFSYMYTLNTGISAFYLTLIDSPITSLKIGVTGDVYVDNYKRGKIQISDIFQNYTAEGRIFGDSEIKVNDGFITKDNHNYINIQYCQYENENVPWINSTNEIVAWANKFSFYPIGITDYDISSYDIYWKSSFYQYIDNKYVLFPTATCKIDNDILYIEENVFHFLKNSTVYSGYTEISDIYISHAISMLGTYVVQAGICISNSPDFNFSDSNTIIYPIGTTTAIASESFSNSSITQTYAFAISEVKQGLKDLGITSSRIYYIPYVIYKKYAYDEDNIAQYSSDLFTYRGGVVKYVDID